MSGIVIADAGPLIALARIERLSLLQTLYGPVTVPQAVLTELRLGSERPGARLLYAALGAGEMRPWVQARSGRAPCPRTWHRTWQP